MCVNCCLYDSDGEVEFFEDAGVLGGIVQEYHPALLRQARDLVAATRPGSDRHRWSGHRTSGRCSREHDAPRVIDYWSLDTEGSELAILRSFPFDAYAVRVLTVEHNGTSMRWQIRRFLESRGYEMVRELGIDDAYVPRGAGGVPSWRSRAWSRSAPSPARFPR